jgi:glycosyltransferase involved in cell wall biosynthesis
MAGAAPVSLVVLTYNEEANLPFLLESAGGQVGEIVVVDSFSTDRTCEIAERCGARVYQHAFENQAKQFNWALDNIPLRHDWVLRLDADETVAGDFGQRVSAALANTGDDVTGFYLRRRLYFMGRWMKHGGMYPRWILRLFRKDAGRYEDTTEEHVVLRWGKARKLALDFTDNNRRGLTYWVDKHNHWALGEMLDTMALMGYGTLAEGTVRARLTGTQEQRTRWLKGNIYARTPLFLRSFLYFAYRYFLRLGFLDGTEGLIFHFLQAFWYRFLVDAKIYEARKFGLERACLRSEYTGSRAWEDRLAPTDSERKH